MAFDFMSIPHTGPEMGMVPFTGQPVSAPPLLQAERLDVYARPEPSYSLFPRDVFATIDEIVAQWDARGMIKLVWWTAYGQRYEITKAADGHISQREIAA